MQTQPVIKKLTVKNQLTIPADMLKEIDVEKKGRLLVRLSSDKRTLVLEPVDDPIAALAGIWKGKTDKTSTQLKQEIRKEEANYEKKKFKTQTSKK
jgi:bifunctional DNA-binding transcriptional regulator/antitoxin component of YhaV-PrlF toxin-antitoxin module